MNDSRQERIDFRADEAKFLSESNNFESTDISFLKLCANTSVVETTLSLLIFLRLKCLCLFLFGTIPECWPISEDCFVSDIKYFLWKKDESSFKSIIIDPSLSTSIIISNNTSGILMTKSFSFTIKALQTRLDSRRESLAIPFNEDLQHLMIE